MIQQFVDRFMASKGRLRATFGAKHPDSYEEVVRAVISILDDDTRPENERPDPSRIHEIDDGAYQGTLVYVIASKAYQPSTYWYVRVEYGSCTGCDTLRGIRGYSDGPPAPQHVRDYMTLALHVVQRLKQMDDREGGN